MSSKLAFTERLNALGKTRLEHGVKLYIECHSNSDNIAGPSWAMCVVDVKLLELAETASDAVHVHPGWEHVCLHVEPNEVAPDSDIDVPSWSLRVDDDSMTFLGRTSHGATEIFSRGVAFVELLAAMRTDAFNIDRVGWHGGALLVSEDLDHLRELVEVHDPIVAANLRAELMADTIEQSGQVSDAAAPRARSRMRL